MVCVDSVSGILAHPGESIGAGMDIVLAYGIIQYILRYNVTGSGVCSGFIAGHEWQKLQVNVRATPPLDI